MLVEIILIWWYHKWWCTIGFDCCEEARWIFAEYRRLMYIIYSHI